MGPWGCTMQAPFCCTTSPSVLPLAAQHSLASSPLCCTVCPGFPHYHHCNTHLGSPLLSPFPSPLQHTTCSRSPCTVNISILRFFPISLHAWAPHLTLSPPVSRVSWVMGSYQPCRLHCPTPGKEKPQEKGAWRPRMFLQLEQWGRMAAWWDPKGCNLTLHEPYRTCCFMGCFQVSH